MDHWRDPWADHVNTDDKSPAKSEVASPQPQPFAPLPVPLDAFVDDAGWGSNESSGSGDWSASPQIDDHAPAHVRALGGNTTEHAPSSARWDTVQGGESAPSSHDGEEPGLDVDNTGPDTFNKELGAQHLFTRPEHLSNNAQWDAVEPADHNEDLENVTPETSESIPTIQLHDTVEQHPIDAPAPTHHDQDSSARPSTSPSDASHDDAPAESSSRTSFEEEDAAKSSGARQTHDATRIKEEPQGIHGVVAKSVSPRPAHTLASSPGTVAQDAAFPAPTSLDATLMADLFPPIDNVKVLDDAPDDPIYSTKARKAWYRLTRKQTMREYNAGNDDDNYVRVNWANSHIRLKVNNTVGRWAREDRISGTGAGARASFYWDTTAPLDMKSTNSHVRAMSAASNSAPIVSVRQSMPPLPSKSTVAFNWTSPTEPVDPWRKDSSEPQSTSPVAPKHAAVAKLRGHGTRSASVDSPTRTRELAARREAATLSNETMDVRTSGSPPYPNPAADLKDPWANLSNFDNDTTTREESASIPVDDDDDWGEMVQSPTITTPYSSDPFSHHIVHSDTLPVTSVSPQLVGIPPAQDDSTDEMHTSPIVRLRSTISPTSALFRKNSFVLLSIEPGPIGPGILKPTNRPAGSPLDKKTSQIPATLPQESLLDAEKQSTTLNSKSSDKPSIWQTPILGLSSIESEEDHASILTSQPQLATPLCPSPQSLTTAPPIDTWADADFSFLESSVPSQLSAPQHNTSDPFSIFGTSSGGSSSSAQPFSRSPPRSVTPTPPQPLTGATNSAQRRKAEEDQIIRDIMIALPNLTYMLR